MCRQERGPGNGGENQVYCWVYWCFCWGGTSLTKESPYLLFGRSGRCTTVGCPNEAYAEEVAEWEAELLEQADAFLAQVAEHHYERTLELFPVAVSGMVTTWASH